MFMIHDGKLVGALLIGNIKLMKACRDAIEKEKPVNTASIEDLIDSLARD
jgi:hypothetical protein